MKLYVNITNDECSDEELLNAIKMAREGDMVGPNINITVLDNPENDPVLNEWYEAGLYMIDRAYFMYDGSIHDTEEMFRDMTKEQAKIHVTQIRRISQTLLQGIEELHFDRGLIYKQHDEW